MNFLQGSVNFTTRQLKHESFRILLPLTLIRFQSKWQRR